MAEKDEPKQKLPKTGEEIPGGPVDLRGGALKYLGRDHG